MIDDDADLWLSPMAAAGVPDGNRSRCSDDGSMETIPQERTSQLVGHAMHCGLVSCAVETRLRDVATLMAQHEIHCVVVFDYGDDGDANHELFGIVSDGDVARAIADGTLDLRTAGDTATALAYTVRADDELQVAAKTLAAHKVGHVIVVDGVTKRPVGVLSTLDLARSVAS